MSRVPVPPCVGPGMCVRRALLKPRDVVYVKGLLEAADGLAQLFAEEGGAVTIATTNTYPCGTLRSALGTAVLSTASLAVGAPTWTYTDW